MTSTATKLRLNVTRNKNKTIKSLYGNIFDSNCGLQKRRKRMLKKLKKKK